MRGRAGFEHAALLYGYLVLAGFATRWVMPNFKRMTADKNAAMGKFKFTHRPRSLHCFSSPVLTSLSPAPGRRPGPPCEPRRTLVGSTGVGADDDDDSAVGAGGAGGGWHSTVRTHSEAIAFFGGGDREEALARDSFMQTVAQDRIRIKSEFWYGLFKVFFIFQVRADAGNETPLGQGALQRTVFDV